MAYPAVLAFRNKPYQGVIKWCYGHLIILHSQNYQITVLCNDYYTNDLFCYTKPGFGHFPLFPPPFSSFFQAKQVW